MPGELRSIRFEGAHTIQGAGFTVTVGVEVLANATIEGLIELSPDATISGTGSPTLTLSGQLNALGDFEVTGVVVNAANGNNTFNGTITVGAGGTFLVSEEGALGSAVPATVGLHLAGGTVRMSGFFSTIPMGINRLTGNGTLDLVSGALFDVRIATANLFTGTTHPAV